MVNRSAQRRKTADHGLETPTDLGPQCHKGYHCGIKCAPGRRFRALHQDQEHPLACQWPAFPRLSSAVREVGDRNPCHDRRKCRTGAQSGRSTSLRRRYRLSSTLGRKQRALPRSACRAGRTVRRHKRFTASTRQSKVPAINTKG
jgi:hypothetical protein